MQLKRAKIREILEIFIRRINIIHTIVGICFAGLFVWCLFNVTKIMGKYFRFETIVSLQNDPPVWTDFPGITICAPSIFTPQKLAELYPDFSRYFAYLKSNYTEAMQYARQFKVKSGDFLGNFFGLVESMAMDDYNASDIIDKLSVQLDDLLVDCKLHPLNTVAFSKMHNHHRWGSKRCTDIKPIFHSIHNGQKCFTFFSDLVHMTKELELSDSDSLVDTFSAEVNERCDDMSDEFCRVLKDAHSHMVYDLNPTIDLHFRAIENEIWNTYIEAHVRVVVHPPNMFPNLLDFRYFELRPNNFYEIKFSKKTTYLLQPPYQTMCINYPDEPKFQENKIITRDQCISHCVNAYIQRLGQTCANYYTVLIGLMFNWRESMKICNHTTQNFSNYLNARDYCQGECPVECTTVLYEMAGHVSSTFEEKCQVWYKIRQNGPNGHMVDENDNAVLNETHDTSFDAITIDKYFVVDDFTIKKPSSFLSLKKYGQSIEKDFVIEKQNSENVEYSSSSSSLRKLSSRCDPRVTFRISPTPFTTVRHQKAITQEAFLGTIGGHMGIWLGLSLYKLIKFGVRILYKMLQRIVDQCSPKIQTTKTEPDN